MSLPPLKTLHSKTSLVASKLETFRRIDTDALLDSLRPGEPGALKVKPDGTVMDGHHRIAVLRERKVDVNALPREAIADSPGEDT